MDLDDHSVLVGRAGEDGLRLRVLRRSYPEASDYRDGNRADTEVELTVGAFRGLVRSKLRTNELFAFRAELQAVFDALSGEARLTTMENWLSVLARGDGKGHVTVEGELTDDARRSGSLRFRFQLDPTDLPPVLRGLEGILRAFPVLGRP